MSVVFKKFDVLKKLIYHRLIDNLIEVLISTFLIFNNVFGKSIEIVIGKLFLLKLMLEIKEKKTNFEYRFMGQSGLYFFL